MEAARQNKSTRQTVGLILGPALFIVLLLLPLDMPTDARKVAAVACLMAVLWITETAPIAATALLPIVLFPLLGVMSSSEATSSYAHHLIYLFLGGFLISVTMQKWNLHKRIAMHTIRLVGVSLNRMVLGFMLATAFLSMWVSNTATTMMMLPIGLAVIGQVKTICDEDQELCSDASAIQSSFAVCLMLGIAYAASIGGVATLIGTPPNAILAGMAEQIYGQRISFFDWLAFGLPLSIIMLFITWAYLTRIAHPSKISQLPGARQLIQREMDKLGSASRQEKWVLVIFLSVSVAWISRGLLDLPLLDKVGDSSIAMAGALLLFVIPSDWSKREFLLDWKTAVSIPWEILILFGGGFTLALGFTESGLSQWIADQLHGLKMIPMLLLLTAVTTTIVFMTEITSNTATATLMIPVMGALAVAIDIHPYALMIAVAIAASYAFMMPVATPPNAIVFSSGRVSMPQMAKTGFWLNLIAAILIPLFILTLLPLLWNLDLGSTPTEFITPEK